MKNLRIENGCLVYDIELSKGQLVIGRFYKEKNKEIGTIREEFCIIEEIVENKHIVVNVISKHEMSEFLPKKKRYKLKITEKQILCNETGKPYSTICSVNDWSWNDLKKRTEEEHQIILKKEKRLKSNLKFFSIIEQECSMELLPF